MIVRTLLLATTALGWTAGSALAQAVPPAQAEPQAAVAPVPTGPVQSAPLADAAQQGVLVFTPDFFADQRPNTALDMVQRLPGFAINDGDGSRGFEGAVGNVLFDGARPASKSDTGSSVLSRTPANQVERIELIRGGAPGVDMQGFSVVANVILKRQSSVQHVVTGTAFLFEGGRDLYSLNYQVTARDGDRNWSLTLGDGVSLSDGQGKGRVVRTDAAGNVIRDEALVTNFFGGGQSVRGNYAFPVLGGRLDATARYGVSDSHSDQLQTSAVARRENFSDTEAASGEVGLVFERPLGSAWKTESRFIHSFAEQEGSSTGRTRLNGVDAPEQVFAFDRRSSETILRGLVRNERSPALTLETGAEAAYNMLDTDQAFSVGGVPVILPSASVMVEELRGEAFGKATWRARPDLTVEGQLRLETSTISQSGDADSEKSLFFAKPRVLATWTPTPAHQVRFRFEREVGQLDFDDFAASASLADDDVFGGNVDLEPEQRWISELIYERRFWGEGVLALTLRHDEIVDALDVIPLPGGLSATGNIGDGTLDRFAVALTLPTDRLGVSGGRLRLNGTWDDNAVTDPTTGETRQSSGVRRPMTQIAWQQDIVSWRLQYGFEYIPYFQERTFDPDQTSVFTLKDYRVLFAEYKPTPTLAIRAQLNLWDDFDQERTAFSARTPARPVAFVERRSIDPRTFWQIRVRKTF